MNHYSSPLGLSNRSLALCRRPRACRGRLRRRASSSLFTYVLLSFSSSSSSFLGEAGHHQLLEPPRLPELLCKDGLPEGAPAHAPSVRSRVILQC